MEPMMPLRLRKILALSVLAGAMGAGVGAAKAADLDDEGYGWEQRGPDDGHWRHGGWDRRGWDESGAVRGAAAEPGFGGCYVVAHPVRDGWGTIVDYRRVEVCD
jgi:hypothetical protein